MWKRVAIAAFLVLLASAPAWAQDERPVGVNFGFGWAFPVSGLKDSFNTGWNGALGVTFNLKPTVGLQAEYMYDRMNGPTKDISLSATPVVGAALTSGILESNHQIHAGTFNVVVRPKSSGVAGGYFLAGGGVYHRIIQITSPSVGYTTFCDPYWYVCYPALVSVDTIIGDRSSTDFGMDFGGGVTFGTDVKFYVEARYHYVWGPTITKPAVGGGSATDLSTNAQYIPLTLGLRW